jgi:isoleucyl-tRNA synthetase
VHLEDWPVADTSLIDEDLLARMEQTRVIVTRVLERRIDAGIAVKQVLSKAVVSIPTGELALEYVDLIKDEANVKFIEIQKGEYAVELDTQLTPELLREGLVREITRRVNGLRKNAGLTIRDRVSLSVFGNTEVARAVDQYKDALLSGTLSSTVTYQEPKSEHTETFHVGDIEITIGFDVE